MTSDEILKNLEHLRDTLREVESKRTRLEGALDEVQKEMKKLGFSSVKKLEAEKVRLLAEKETKTTSLEKELGDFSDKFGELLEELE